MAQILQFFIWIPLLAFPASLLLPRKNEKAVARLVLTAAGLHLGGLVLYLLYWLVNGSPVLDRKHIVLFSAGDIQIFIDFYFDRITAVFALVGSFLSFLVALFSRYYIHREEGFKRFFNTLLLFILGYNLAVFAGNFETLFLGWELLGICSFLLIAFYRDRYLPVKNGLKVISLYRLGDVCLILAMWMSHHLWHENITFVKLNNALAVEQHLEEHQWYSVFICFTVVLAAAIKSAQLPFSSWLPRAMEGPTTSSAIFYGSLSVHLGVFLLLRTYPYWESLTGVRVLVLAIGIGTSLVAAVIARVQPTVKTQIAYSSITQIGLIFAEVALGWHTLALIHFTGNAFLRTYQLLVSPSVLSYRIHDMFFSFKQRQPVQQPSFLNRVKNSLYILSVKEWNLDRFLYHFLWQPFKWVGSRLDFLSAKGSVVVLGLLFLAGVSCHLFPETVPEALYKTLPVLFSVLALLFILKSFAERLDARRAWGFIVASQFFIALAIGLFHEDFGRNYILLYLSGTVVAAIAGYLCLKRMAASERDIDLNRFHGHIYEYPVPGFIFLLSCLGLAGLPFTPTFIGIDLLFNHIHQQELLLIIPVTLSFIFIEIALLRIYARIFLGQHKKAYHPIAYRSS